MPIAGQNSLPNYKSLFERIFVTIPNSIFASMYSIPLAILMHSLVPISHQYLTEDNSIEVSHHWDATTYGLTKQLECTFPLSFPPILTSSPLFLPSYLVHSLAIFILFLFMPSYALCSRLRLRVSRENLAKKQ